MPPVLAAPGFDVHRRAEGGHRAVRQEPPSFPGWLPIGAKFRAVPAAEFWRADPDATVEQALRGKLFTDGSGYKLEAEYFHHAEWAVVRLQDNGEPYAALYGPVGAAFPQTSPAAEWIALCAAALKESGDRELVTCVASRDLCRWPQGLVPSA